MSDDAFTLLVVEDDDAHRTYLADNLSADGYELLVARSVRDGLRLLEQQFPDLAIVDVRLADASGLDLVSAVRGAEGTMSRIDPTLPLLVVSGGEDELDRLRAFERGADDVVSAPVSYQELRARVAALLRRTQGRRLSGRLKVGGLVIDPPAREVRLHGERLALSQKEFALLRMLATQPTRVFTKLELLRSIWGYESLGTTRTLDSHVCRLRAKLARRGERWVVNVWGVGYRLCDGEELTAPAESAPGGVRRALAVAA